MNVTTSHFARERHTPESEHAHITGQWAYIEARCEDALKTGKTKPGYRPGVVLAIIEPSDVMSSLVRLKEGDEVHGVVSKRPNTHPYEAVVVNTFVYGQKVPAAYCEVVLYSRETLLEDHKPEELTGGDYEIVTLLTNTEPGTTPMNPMTFVRNYLHLPGGTEMGITTEEALQQLCESVLFWSQHSQIKPRR